MSDAFEAHFSEEKTEAVKPEGIDGQPRDEGGRFAAKPADQPQPEAMPTAAPAPQAAPAAAAPVAQPAAEAPKPDPQHEKGLYLAMMEERERRQKAERERDELRQQHQTRQIPSVNDPEFAAYQQGLIQQTATTTRFDTSELVARQQHGDDVVQKAMDWAMQRSQASPAFANEYLQQKHPIDWAVRQQKRNALLEEIGDDPEAYKARLIADFQAANPAPTAQPAAASPQPAAPKPTPKPSLASAPTAGGIQTAPVVAPFEAAFSNR